MLFQKYVYVVLFNLIIHICIYFVYQTFDKLWCQQYFNNNILLFHFNTSYINAIMFYFIQQKIHIVTTDVIHMYLM